MHGSKGAEFCVGPPRGEHQSVGADGNYKVLGRWDNCHGLPRLVNDLNV